MHQSLACISACLYTVVVPLMLELNLQAGPPADVVVAGTKIRREYRGVCPATRAHPTVAKE